MTDLAGAVRISSAQAALTVAAELSRSFAEGAGARDAHRILPHEQIQALKDSGLLALTVPVEHGGLDVPVEVLAEVLRLIAHGDPSIGQIPHSHFTFLEALRLQGTPEQQAYFYGLVLDGALFANAQSERGPHPIDVDTTTLTASDAGYVLRGRKYYSTGALFADWLIVRASRSDGSAQVPTAATPKAIAFVPRDASGVEVIDDWDGMGQRTTASGTVTLDAVEVPTAHVVEFSPIFTQPTVYGARAQLLHAALDVGIATAALEEAVRQAAKARPHFEASVSSAVEDPTLVQAAGELTVTVRGAQALLAEAARQVDTARGDLTEDSAAKASIAVAIAKVAAARAAVEAGSALFEFGGTRSASASDNLSRYWRDARTHTLHDATRWKIRHIGNYTLSGTKPPRHGQL
ncbi:SfnB family sulfur acquisition oxidoreductase [Mycolicibacterium conceptionense]|uniref:Dibenzothiophene monooxygenase n=1 Tax=Mycolicibacterium conceptionense TaxID=451644 RepID=A0A0U1DTP4_9MYCO|nr:MULTISPECIES: SfnB family sulfur acquisition oxidoreductase [Mycolicibacterium]MCW1822007.1 SfnB family sulfur acquisition oxidoreductase [Mycolicibacterium senegalense]OBB14055.1 SfnB family sulfur acquisition oxidoreductase [Mycolicibacterium conceptionense]OBF07385.1 SfnB family sulfur acquisition oxidoreductase [Mycolicibacterium conceptionense]OBF14627.1 SfnB family sulfur acquisition oxidoreductase [Mycolicibacterium conceptionense]OBF47823.1 SfnB family sulfur acquisition oxidoreduct